MALLDPQPTISQEECEAGMRRLIYEAAFSGGTTALTSGVILTALALQLGASNVMVGMLAAVPFLSQLLQGPAILLVERMRKRKWISVWSSVIGRLMLAMMGLAVFLPPGIAGLVLLAGQVILCGLGAFGSCAWSAWMRDLAPASRLGHVFARRTMWSSAISLIASLAAGFLLDRTAAGSTGRALAFAALYGFGCVTGLISAAIVARIPEPLMPPPTSEQPGLLKLLGGPLKDRNYLRLIRFLSAWQFAINLATPFFTVFLVKRLGFPMSFVVLLNVVSQLANLASLRSWGSFTDRFSNKSVLLVASPVYILCIVGMIGASNLGVRSWLSAYLIVLHALMGASIAAVTLASTNIALKLSPRGAATAFVAANAVFTSLAAGVAPILGGAFADYFARRQFEILLRWTSPERVLSIAPLTLSHWDFYFLIAGLLGVYSLHRLSLVAEEGEIRRGEMLRHIFHGTRQFARNVSSVAGLRAITEMPSSLLRDARIQTRMRKRLRGNRRRAQAE